MLRLMPVVLVSSLLLTAAVQAQAGSNGLEIKPDPQNVVANALPGSWKLDAELGKRLGNKGIGERLEFRGDATVVEKVPAAFAARLRDRRIYLAGVMVLRGKEQPFLLTEVAGNPTVVWFRDHEGDPMGDAESLIVMLVRAEAKQADLLFVGGDSNNQSFSPYARETKVRGLLEPAAAITDMIRLLEAGKSREFVETYVAPTDLDEMTKQGRTIEKLAARFEGERVKELIEVMLAVSKQPPVMSADGGEASWAVEHKMGQLRLQRIDGRWYLRNR